MRKRLISSILCVAIVLSLDVTGCGNKNTTDADTAKEKEDKETKEEYTEDDLEGIITGLEDHYILEKAEEIDYQHNVEYDEDIIVSIKDNGEKKVDTGKTGKYTVTYTITVDNAKFTEYLEQKAEEEKADKKLEDSKTEDVADSEKAETGDNEDVEDSSKDADTSNVEDAGDTESDAKADQDDTKTEDVSTETDAIAKADDEKKELDDADKDESKTEENDSAKADSSDKVESEDGIKDTDKTEESDDKENEGTTDIEIDKDMTVVDKDTAQDLADKDEVVWGDKNETVEKSDGTEVKEETKAPESTENKNDSNKLDNSKPTSGTSGNNDNSGNSGNSSNNGNTATTPTHTHNWVYHKATGHNETVTIQEAWDEEVPVYGTIAICNICGHESSSTDEAILHSAECGGGYYPKKVQVGTDYKHHDAETEDRWVQDSAAYYSCSCGETKY